MNLIEFQSLEPKLAVESCTRYEGNVELFIELGVVLTTGAVVYTWRETREHRYCTTTAVAVEVVEEL